MKICIICEKEPSGNAYKVQDDFIIKGIRAIKQKLGVAKNNELYVCEPCYAVYKEKRKKFERNIVFYTAMAIIIFVVLNTIPLLSGIFNVFTFITSLVLAAMIIGFSILNYAVPPIQKNVLSAAPDLIVPQTPPKPPRGNEIQKKEKKKAK